MPIVVACPSCQAKLTAPDAAAGKRVKCARCQALIPIPASAPGYDVVEDTPASAKPTVAVAAPQVDTVESRVVRPAKARRPVEVDEEDERPLRRPARKEDEDDEEETPRARRRRDDEEDEAPVKKRRRDEDDDDEDAPRARRRDEDEDDDVPVKKRRRDEDEEDDEPTPKKKRSAMPLIIVGAFVGLLVVGGGGGALAWFLTKKPTVASSSGGPSSGPASNNNNASSPALIGTNWVKLEGPEYPFSAIFPNAAPEKKDPFAMVSDPQMRKLAEAMGKTDLWARVDGGRTFSLTVRELPATPPAAQVKQILGNVGTAASMSAPGGKMEQVDSTSGEWMGYPYRQITFKKPTGEIMILRAMIAKATLYAMSVEGDAGLTASDKIVEEFFSGFEPKPKDAPAGPGAGTKGKGTTTPPKSGGKSKKP